MSKLSKVTRSRKQWRDKTTQSRTDNRYLRREIARVKTQRDQLKRQLQTSQRRLDDFDKQAQGVATAPKVDGIWLALRLFLEVRISFRAVSRVLSLLAAWLGLAKAPCPQTVINWVMRLSIVRIEAARELRGLPLSQVPFSNGLIWMIDLSIGLGSGKILAVLALDAHHHHLVDGAPSLAQVHCIAVSVGDSWTGEEIADLLKRLIAQMGRPAGYLKDGGSELQKAADLLELQGLGSVCIDDISHAAANMLKHYYESHPDFERFVSACGRVSGKLKQTILACLAPPTVRTKARFMNVHRLFTWADRLLSLSPPGAAKSASILARLREHLDELPACKGLIRRFRGDAQGLLACQKMLKTKGLSHDILAQCQPLIAQMPSAPVRLAFEAYLSHQLKTAETLGLDQVGLPISSDAIESLFGVAKRHGVGQTQDAARMALRLPALCGTPTREEVEQVLGISVARQHEVSGQLTSLNKQRREVFGGGKDLESLGQSPVRPRVELLPRAKNRANNAEILDLSMDNENQGGPHRMTQQVPEPIENVEPPGMRQAVVGYRGQKPINDSRPI